MNWLDGLKESRRVDGRNLINYPEFSTELLEVRVGVLDRLIEIAEECEGPKCKICGSMWEDLYQTYMGHQPWCPYHEDWKP